MNLPEFQQLLRQRGEELYRDMPWRRDTRPYYILVSELMLQQTQVDRVIPKFEAFIDRFPDERSLATATLGEVLTLWSGLGYNRRAQYLQAAAKQITNEWGGVFPSDEQGLRQLPGVGPGTAGAICAYAYNQPVVYIETNVRTVYFHHFFPEGDKVTDAQIAALVGQTVDRTNPRDFYWALMDYGSWLKRQGVGRIQQSQHYRKQTPLAGSLREMRGRIVRELTASDMSRVQLADAVGADARFDTALAGLRRDGLVMQSSEDIFHLTK